MRPLARYEIIDQLERLGIHSPDERQAFLNDYVQYFNCCSESWSNRISRTVRGFLGRGSSQPGA